MTPTERLLALVRSGHQLMARERALLLEGAFERAAGLAAEKRGLLAALEQAMAGVRNTEPVRAALAGLIADGRHNERLIVAARQGLAFARRRLDAIVATLQGAVAYDCHGQPITSRDDAVQKRRRA